MKIIQHIVGAQERITFAHSCQEDDGIFRCVLLNILDDQTVVFANLHGVTDCLYDSPEAPLLLEVTAFLYKILALQKVNDNVVEVENNQLIFVGAFQIFVLHIFDPLTDFQFLLWRIIKNPVVDLISFSTALPKGRLLNCRLHRVQPCC